MPKNIMREFKLLEISAVDRPAQEHALAVIMKRDAPPSPAAVVILKYWGASGLEVSNPAKTFLGALAQQERFKDQNEVMEVLGPAFYALDESLRSIAADTSLSAPARQAMMQVSTEEFLGTVRTKWPEVDQEISKVLESTDMTKTVAELEASVAELTTKATTTDAALAKATSELATAKADLAKAQTELAAATVLAKMTAEEREADEKLKDDEKKAFRAASSSDRAATIAKMRAADETLKVGDSTILKSVVGAGTFAVLKAQQVQIDTANKVAADERELRKTSEFAKMADDQFGSFAGETIAKAAALRAVDGLPDAVKATLMNMLTAGEGALKGAFATIGTRGTTEKTRDAVSAFNKRVAEVKTANPKMGQQDVFTLARTTYPAEFKAYQESGN